MKEVSEMVYVLSATYHSADGDGSMYLGPRYEGSSNDEVDVDTIASLSDCLVFYTEQEAWEYRESSPSNGWQITPLPAKRVFLKRLKGR